VLSPLSWDRHASFFDEQGGSGLLQKVGKRRGGREGGREGFEAAEGG